MSHFNLSVGSGVTPSGKGLRTQVGSQYPLELQLLRTPRLRELSACNTAAGDKPGAEALSGLARAFFYAGARSLVVSHWNVDSEATVKLMSGLFAALKTNPGFSHGEALRSSMLQMIGNPEWAQPKLWAFFVIVGEPKNKAFSWGATKRARNSAN